MTELRSSSGRGAVTVVGLGMDDKYNLRKSREPETKQEMIQHQSEDLVKRRDKSANHTEKQALQKEIMRLFAQYERLKL